MTNRQHIATKLSVILLSIIILALTCISPYFTYAKADDEIVDYTPYSKVYYFTDYEGYDRYLDGISETLTEYQELVNPECDTEITVYDWSDKTEGNTFIDKLMYDYKYDETYKNIKDAFVIFEMRDRFPIYVLEDSSHLIVTSVLDYLQRYVPHRIVEQEEDILYNVLYNVFGTFKENNCKIMFICGTDEVSFTDGNQFYNDDSFLNFVDIHINLDIFLPYIQTIFDESLSPERIENSTLILDYSLSNYKFFAQFLAPYVIELYDDDSYRWDEVWNNDYFVFNSNVFKALSLMMERHVHLFLDRTIYDDSFFGAFRGFDKDADLLIIFDQDPNFQEEKYFDIDGVYPIATMNKGGKNFDSWIYWFEVINRWGAWENTYVKDPEDRDPYIYMYRGTKTDEEYKEIMGKYDFGEYNKIRQAGSLLPYIDEWLPLMIYDFIIGKDLSQYHNYDGICNVSFKAMTFGGGGWMTMPPSVIGAAKGVMDIATFLKMYAWEMR